LRIAILGATGEAVRKLALSLGEDVDRVVAVAHEELVEIGGALDTDQHQWWIEGERGESVDGHPCRPGAVAGSHHADTRGEAPQNRPELLGGNAHSLLFSRARSSGGPAMLSTGKYTAVIGIPANIGHWPLGQ